MQSVLNADWFHGFLSSTEAEKLLEAQPPGTFLIRFSKSKAGSFAIAYVEGPKATSIRLHFGSDTHLSSYAYINHFLPTGWIQD